MTQMKRVPMWGIAALITLLACAPALAQTTPTPAPPAPPATPVPRPAQPEMIPADDVTLDGLAAPDFTLPTLDGGTLALAELRGQPVILAFWASWCRPCKQEIPALVAFQKQHPEVRVVTVNVDRDPADARKSLQRMQSSLPVALDTDASVAGRYLLTAMPLTVLLDGNGTVKLVKAGYGATEGLTALETALKGLK